MKQINKTEIHHEIMRNIALDKEKMYLRDHFAGLAMQGYINNSSEFKLQKDQTYDQALAIVSYLIADAMMEARK